MSYEGSDDEWEVVDIVHTSTVSVKHDPEPIPAKKEDVDALAKQIRKQLSLKTTHDTQQILLLERKMKEQQRMSEQQLLAIQTQLQQITDLALNQQHQNAHLEAERDRLIQTHRKQMANQNDEIQSIKRLQMTTDAQLQAHNTQIAAAQKAVLTAQQQNMALFANATLPPPPKSMPPNNQKNSKNNGHNNNNNNNGWLPSFPSIPWNFNNNNNNSNNGRSNGHKNSGKGALQHNNGNNYHPSSSANHNVLDMDMSPYNQAEEKANVLMEDDECVLDWTNDYGTQEINNNRMVINTNPIADNPKLLKTHGIIGEGKFEPNETRQCGWVLKNKSSVILRLNTHLECLGGDKEEFGVRVKLEKSYEFAIKPKEEVYILIEVVAPAIPGKYCSFYQMVMDDGSKIGEMLEVTCEVKPKFNSTKEKKIAQCIKMGFNRKKVVYTLQKHKWKINNTVNELIGSS